MIIQYLNKNNLMFLPVKDCRSESLISYTDGSKSLRYASWQVVVNKMNLLTITNRGNPLKLEIKWTVLKKKILLQKCAMN